MKTLTRATLLVIIACLPLFAAAQAPPQDVITVGNVTAIGSVVDVPVYIRDTSGTPLGIDQPFGSRIQAYSIKVNYAPTTAVSGITFTRAGITQPLTPTFESSPAAPGTISLLDAFSETTDLIPFTSNAALPGQVVGHLLVTLSPSAAPGSTITLTLDPVLTQLNNEGGTTTETVQNGQLALVNGAILVPSTIPTLAEWGLVLLAAALAVAALRLRL